MYRIDANKHNSGAIGDPQSGKLVLVRKPEQRLSHVRQNVGIRNFAHTLASAATGFLVTPNYPEAATVASGLSSSSP